ncbi:MAG: hypothetical protein DMF72_06090 [Acidobacteria bacterium]|nr:MAG: hypothetical protein DMF72_06090 [Acidobacteriota bacterium]
MIKRLAKLSTANSPIGIAVCRKQDLPDKIFWLHTFDYAGRRFGRNDLHKKRRSISDSTERIRHLRAGHGVLLI